MSLIIGIGVGILALTTAENISPVAHILASCFALLFIIWSLLLARFSGRGNADNESSFKKNEIFETIWYIKEADRYTVKVRSINRKETIVKMSILPPKVFKVIGKRNYIAYPPPKS